jgi:hypothetical protein
MEHTGPDEDPVDLEELKRIKELLEQPIDFDELIADGVIEESSGDWYKLLDYESLPEHARKKVHRMKESEEGFFVQFSDPPSK